MPGAEVPPAPPVLDIPAPAVSGPTAEMEEMLRRTLLLAQRTADQAVAEAQAEADRLKSEAAAHAAHLVGEARSEADRQEREAAARRETALAAIEADRRSIEAQVEALRGFEREYRTRLKAYLELQLRELETVGRTTTPAAPPPAAPIVSGEAAPGVPSDGFASPGDSGSAAGVTAAPPPV
jgi:hypothetical protein